MQNRKKQKVVIGTLVAVIIGMVVGYAALNQILNINGTSKIVGDFNIQFTNIAEHTMVGAKTITTGGIGTTTANFTVDLEKPGSSAIYDVTVENKGSIDAILKSIEGLDESNLSNPLDIKFSLIGIEEGDPLLSTESKTFQVKVVWDSSATSVPSESKTLTLHLNYEQKTSTGSVATPESCFTVDDSGTITNYTCSDTDVVIPSSVNGVTVTKIGSGSFMSKGLTSVEIPNTITTIGSSAFAGNQLTNVEIPDSVTSIDENAFISNKLASAIIGNGVKTIGKSAFAQNQLTTVEFGSGLNSIGTEAFDRNQLTSVNIPNTVTSIGERSFIYNQLTSINIPDSVTDIGSGAFVGNQLTSVTIGTGVTTIGSGAFWIQSSSNSNPNLTHIINKTGRSFDWYNVASAPCAPSITGTCGNVIITDN